MVVIMRSQFCGRELKEAASVHGSTLRAGANIKSPNKEERRLHVYIWVGPRLFPCECARHVS